MVTEINSVLGELHKTKDAVMNSLMGGMLVGWSLAVGGALIGWSLHHHTDRLYRWWHRRRMERGWEETIRRATGSKKKLELLQGKRGTNSYGGEPDV